MSTAKTFFEWCVPYFSGYYIIKEIDSAYFSSFFLKNFFGSWREHGMSNEGIS